jgi:hypothetical protein
MTAQDVTIREPCEALYDMSETGRAREKGSATLQKRSGSLCRVGHLEHNAESDRSVDARQCGAVMGVRTDCEVRGLNSGREYGPHW